MKGQTTVYNQSARSVSNELKQTLLRGIHEAKTATIDGPLFMPERNTSLVLTVEQLNFSPP
jgi:hypothetical protein